MPRFTIRLSEEEMRILTRRSRQAGMSNATFVLRLIREKPFETAADVLADMDVRLGDKRLAIR
jgi:hypothetical protein